MNRTITRRFVGATALAVVASAIPFVTNAAVAAPLTVPSTPAGTLTFSGAQSGTAAAFQLASGSTLTCPGDSATNGYRWHTFYAARATDIASWTWTGAGSPPAAIGQGNLWNNTGTGVVRNQLTEQTTGNILTIPSGSFGLNTTNTSATQLPAGEYYVGLACTLSNLTERYWRAPVTLTTAGGGAAFVYGFVPNAPTITSTNAVSANGQSVVVNFTLPDPTPAPGGSGCTATVKQGVTVISTQTGSCGTSAAGVTTGQLTVTGLTALQAYTVEVQATNATGAGASSSTSNFTTAVTPYGAVQNLTAVAGTGINAGSITVTWTAPVAPGNSPTGYTVSMDGGAATAQTSPYTVSGLNAGQTYSFVVTPVYASPFTGTASAPATATANSASFVTQTITFTRPAGVLILTQRCGSYGDLVAFPDTNGFPGFPRPLGAVTGNSLTPSSPALNLGTAPTGESNFGQYPVPTNPTYPTNCGIAMGTASLITSVDDPTTAGQFFAAQGQLNQVTVVDTRSLEANWTVTGQIAGGFSSGSDSFSGNYFGWVPRVTHGQKVTLDSDIVYNPLATAGSTVLPGTGVPSGTGFQSAVQTLASATAGSDLGEFTLDARVLLLIPVTADAGNYSGILTLSLI